ncbi:MAG: hypothetical protein NC453_11415 [Muribaculum sp.]|nr:hypothetical protein [Muribaculum sp.]
MYDQSLEQLIDAVIADGVITDQERRVVYKKAASLGIDQDEIEVYLEGRLQKAQKSAAPKSGKHGVVKTCPNCGAPINPASTKCDECGFLFTGIEASDVVKEFERRINEASLVARPGVIKSFPVPNTQEALFAMIEYLQPFTDTYSGSNVNPFETGAYQAKFKECITRAKIAFPNHPQVTAYRQLDKQRKGKQGLIMFLSSVVLLAFLGVGGYIGYNAIKEKSSTNNATEFPTESEGPILVETSENTVDEDMLDATKELSNVTEENPVTEGESEDETPDTYAQSLIEQIQNLPVPDTKNYLDCYNKFSNIRWTKKFDDQRYAKESFAKAKSAYAKLLKKAYAEAGVESEYIPSEISSTSEYNFYN